MPRMSLEAKLYYGNAGSTAATEITNVRDLSMPFEVGEAEINSRASVWELVAAGLIKASIEWEMNWNEADAALVAIYGAFFARTPLAFRTKDYSGGKGIDADFMVTKFEKDESLPEAQRVKIGIKPTYTGARYPTWV